MCGCRWGWLQTPSGPPSRARECEQCPEAASSPIKASVRVLQRTGPPSPQDTRVTVFTQSSIGFWSVLQLSCHWKDLKEQFVMWTVTDWDLGGTVSCSSWHQVPGGGICTNRYLSSTTQVEEQASWPCLDQVSMRVIESRESMNKVQKARGRACAFVPVVGFVGGPWVFSRPDSHEALLKAQLSDKPVVGRALKHLRK